MPKMEMSGKAGKGDGAKLVHLEPSGYFFLLLYFFNHTNKYYLKVLCPRMEMSGVAGKGGEARDKRGLEM